MDADRFDALSRRVAAPSTRRATLGAMAASGLLGALGLARPAPAAQDTQGQLCTMAFVAAVRMGPSLDRALAPDGTQPGQLQGTLRFALAKNGTLERAALTLPDDTSLPVVGQATGHALQLRIAVDERTAVVAMGVGEAEIATCRGAVDGTTVGPQGGDLGEWHARAQGLTGATGGSRSERGNDRGQGGQSGPQGPTDDGGRTGREGRGDRRSDSGPAAPAGTTSPTGSAGPTGPSGPTAAAQAACGPGLTRCGDHCVDLRNDRAHCGACGQECAEWADCVRGICGLSCPEGQTDCGVCADLLTDPAHCGGCNATCDAGVACVAGSCGGDGGASCPDGQIDCGGGCTDLDADPANCGYCGIACADGETCAAGVCVAVGGCGGYSWICDGVCVDLITDAAHCGACGAACAADEVCSGAGCVPAGGTVLVDCTTQGLTDCGGVCVDVDSDVANCGGCGVACAAGQSCGGGVCVALPGLCAEQGLADCGGVCVDSTTDAANCGACFNACAPGVPCIGGICGGAPPPPDCVAQGLTDCGGFCVDTFSDPAHCGGCGMGCTSGTLTPVSCVAGDCV